MSRHRGRRNPSIAAAVAALAVAATLAACSGQSADEAFCDQVGEVQAAGALFPSRTDGEPVPNDAALVAIEGLAEGPPAEIENEVQVLVDESRRLVAGAEERLGRTPQVQTPSRRWSRTAVESAQSAVIRYAASSCDIDLTSTPPE